MKILCIGNSFSQDATAQLRAISNGEIDAKNLYISAGSLNRHLINRMENNPVYQYQTDGERTTEKVSIMQALERDKWDVITIQQVSLTAGLIESYGIAFKSIVEYLKKRFPNTRIALHRTWSYDIDCTREGFERYNCDSAKMWEMTKYTTDTLAARFGLEIIDSGDAIEKVRKLTEFDRKNGGISLNRDGSHLTYDYGRYAAALAWYKHFGGNLDEVKFIPQDSDEDLCKKIKEALK